MADEKQQDGTMMVAMAQAISIATLISAERAKMAFQTAGIA
jgi:hypothetical protein